jgi:hypothetical protein
MTTLANLSKNYPDIKPELKALLEDSLELGDVSAGFKNRAYKILKKLS